jgi:hypothetical protein
MTVNTDQAIFDAIGASIKVVRGGFEIHTKKFIEAFNAHRDRALCTTLDVAQQPGMREALQQQADKIERLSVERDQLLDALRAVPRDVAQAPPSKD